MPKKSAPRPPEFVAGTAAAAKLGISYSHLCALRKKGLIAGYHYRRISNRYALRHTYRYHPDRIERFLAEQ